MSTVAGQDVAAVVNLTRHELERHVQQALQTAWQISLASPISAADVLIACITQGGSEAFVKVRDLVGSPDLSLSLPAMSPIHMSAVPMKRELARSYYVAEPILVSASAAMWGRDLVTMALLSRDDDDLGAALARITQVSLDELRAQWLQFVRSGRHRSPEQWDQWWAAAGLTPAGRAQPTQTGGAYLLTWNPARYSPEELGTHAEKLGTDGTVTFGWSSGNNRSMEPGDRVFLLRQGAGMRGLVGVGTVDSPPEEKRHWDPAQREQGRMSWIVQVTWEALTVEPIIDLAALAAETGETRLWATQVGGVSIDPDVYSRLEQLWPGAWNRRRHHLRPAESTPLLPRQLIARLDPDEGTPTDSLNVQRYVDAFARVAASKELTPPLSVGLFGDWGSGKSYFMESVHTKVRELADTAKTEDESPYLPNVCQMRFNAWHYAETDLWASLVSTIFKELRTHIDGEGESEADEFNRLLNELEITKQLREDAVKDYTRAKTRRAAAAGQVTKAERTLKNVPRPKPPTEEQLRAILTKGVKDVLVKEPTTADDLVRLLDDAYQLTGEPAFHTASEGITSGKTTVEEARDLLASTRAMASRTSFWWRLLTTAQVHKNRKFRAAVVGLVAILVAIPVVFVFIQSRIDYPIGWSAGLLEAAAVLGALGAWARTTMKRAAPVFSGLDRAQASIERAIERDQNTLRRTYRTEVERARAREREALLRLENAREALRVADDRVETAQAALQASTSDARLGRFIRERAASADYEKYLGLIATIHGDFKKLCTLMDPDAVNRDPTLPRVDRIVLYIDDLDRCYPPSKVVRVLEAVHLLLFFPLFVVFVGVDSRWVSRALNRYYEQMLSDEALVAEEEYSSTPTRAPASSQDFLEKIFQVPFWLRRMDPEAVKRVIHSLVRTDEIEQDDGQLPVDPLGGEGGVVADGVPEQKDEPPTPAPPLPDRKKAQPLGAALAAESPGRTLGEPDEPPTEALRIRKVELDFMDKVAPLMPRTPRSVKRFVNIYRLYKAALSTPGLEKFLGTPEHPGNFRAVQVLLALVIGSPDFAKAVIDVLDTLGEDPDDPTPKRLSDLPTMIDRPAGPTSATTLEGLEEFATGDDDLTLASLREISPLVTRYSLHNMVSAAPGESALG